MINEEYLKFFALGDIYEISVGMNIPEIIRYCKQAEFKPRDRNIHSLSLTSVDGTLSTAVDGGLKYIDGLNDAGIRVPTVHFDPIARHMPFLDECKPILGRTRIFRAGSCGTWEPHRDGSSVIRVMIPLLNCNRKNFYFILEDKLVPLIDGHAYVVNTLKEHAGMVFTEDAYIMVLTLIPGQEAAKILTKALVIR